MKKEHLIHATVSNKELPLQWLQSCWNIIPKLNKNQREILWLKKIKICRRYWTWPEARCKHVMYLFLGNSLSRTMSTNWLGASAASQQKGEQRRVRKYYVVCRQTSYLPEAGIPALLGRCLLATYSSIWGTAGLQQILCQPTEEFQNKAYPWVQESLKQPFI